MNLQQLWIGDTVRLKSSGKIGTYIGQNSNGKARVKCGVKVILSGPKNIELYAEPDQLIEHVELLPLEDEKRDKLPVSNVIDLHIERLNPTLTNEAPQIILNHQLTRCKDFIRSAIQSRLNTISIIHGRGTGQLKLEVNFLLSQFEEFNYAIPVNDGGATEAWFRYG